MNGLRRTASIVAAVVAVGLLAVGWIGAVSDTEPAETAQIAVVLTLVVLGAQGAGLRITWLRPAAWTGVLVQLVALETLLGAARQADVDSVLAFVVGWLVLSPVPALLVWNRANGLRAGRPDAVGASWGGSPRRRCWCAWASPFPWWWRPTGATGPARCGGTWPSAPGRRAPRRC